MHVLFLPSWYTTSDNRVYGSFFAEQATAVSRCGHRVSVISYHRDAKGRHYAEKSMLGDVTEYRIHYKWLPLHMTTPHLMGYFRELFEREFRHDRPDIIHVQSYNALPFARFLKALYGIPYVVTEHVTWFERGLVNEKKKKEIRRGFRSAAAVIAVSDGLREQIRPLSEREILVVPNLVNEDFFGGDVAARRGEPFRFVSIAGLDKKKGLDVLVAAFEKAAAVESGITLTVYGSGSELEALTEQAKNTAVSEKIRFPGRVEREDCPDALRESDCFVLPSRVETFGVVYVEAMAVGLPIVMTKTNAWKNLVNADTGLAVEIDDADALAEAMVCMVRERENYNGERIRAFCRENFSEAVVGRCLTEVYEAVLERK